jgi:ABC-type phosphate transport system auxiliary subunit
MVHSIEARRHRIDELAHKLLADEFMMDRHDLEELVRVSRELDDLQARRINFLEREVDILRLKNEVLHAENDTKKTRIKSLKHERGILRGQVHWLEVVLKSNDIQYRQEIDAERDPGIKHNVAVARQGLGALEQDARELDDVGVC